MPSAAATPSSLYPLAILDCGASSFRLTLQPTPPTHSLPPIHISPNAIARTRPPSKTIFVGSDIEGRCTDFSGLTLRLSIERGFLTDWVAQKTLWDAEIGKALSKLPTKDLATSSSGKLLEGWNLIITEAYFNLPELENGLETMWFEEYGVRGLWRTTGAQLASFAPLQATTAKLSAATSDPATSSDTPGESGETPVAEASSAGTEFSSPAKTTAASPPAQSPPTATGRRQKRQTGSTQSYTETKSKAKSAASGPRLSSHRRPEACVVVDLGHSYTHVVPIVQGEVAWTGVRRLDIGGKLMTNLLKEMISFQQWDMMEESWIISHLKEKAFFVAASDWEEERIGPSSWNRKKLLKLVKSKRGLNPIEQEFVLPDYTDDKVSKHADSRYGRIRKGPGKREATNNKTVKLDARLNVASTSKLDEEEDALQEEKEADAFIADPALAQALAGPAGQDRGHAEKRADDDADDDDDDDDEDAGEDYRESGSESGGESPIKGSFQAHQQQQKSSQPAKHKAGGANEAEEEQVLLLSNERWQIPELLFNPQQIGESCEMVESACLGLPSDIDTFSACLLCVLRRPRRPPPATIDPLLHLGQQRRRCIARADVRQHHPRGRSSQHDQSASPARSRLALPRC
ncbi:actin-like ATPase domain-containing protein [Microstroma glucosiphilum]|uniref:Actin-like ATPase domain-containing protein n=1 Tax=Pseudomicrostroma glucosiphilum TaxID=1684307 RepID=A0A316TWZ4_9BASI|nr:actin-like ATPase domain-containing protein [Pseudomicrostroma glucosiphilum]PWN17959.1 actin-like ATPase domain-containing protein [Pseudomicrostroma glucosiphilum]